MARISPDTTRPAERFIGLKELQQITLMTAGFIDRAIATDGFPPPRNISPVRNGWLESEVIAWMQGRKVPTAYERKRLKRQLAESGELAPDEAQGAAA